MSQNGVRRSRGRWLAGHFGTIFLLIDLGICHSKAEAAYFTETYKRARCRFIVIPFGTTVFNREVALAAYRAGDGGGGDIVTAGRSQRDYRTLAEAVRTLPTGLRIICDPPGPLAGVEPSDKIIIVRNCYDWDYITELANSLFVAIPLSNDDISAGQMVLLQARALGKAVVISRTRTTLEYADDGEDALLVPLGDVEAMQAAIQHLLQDGALRERIAAASLQRFERQHSTEAYIQALVKAIEARVSPGLEAVAA